MKGAQKHSTKRTQKLHPSRVSRKVVVDFPDVLFQRAERAAAALSTNRSGLIRAAVEHYLQSLERERMERELADGYTANTALDRRISQEFSAVDFGEL
jgi:metal-responsive CopG/Arc/MetJ family transcriptional regulator